MSNDELERLFSQTKDGLPSIPYLCREVVNLRSKLCSRALDELNRMGQQDEHEDFLFDLFQSTSSQIKLIAGEMTEQEMRIVQAVLSGLYEKYRSVYGAGKTKA
jgi:hypothetical protein